MNNKYWVNDDGYIMYSKGDKQIIVCGMYPEHVQPLTKIIESHDDLLAACELALSKFRLMYEKIEAGYDAEDLYTDSKSWPLKTLRDAIEKAK